MEAATFVISVRSKFLAPAPTKAATRTVGNVLVRAAAADVDNMTEGE